MKTNSVSKRLLKELGGSKILLLLSLFCSLGGTLLTLAVPFLAGRAIDGIAANGKIDWQALRTPLLLILLCAAGAGLLHWVMQLLNNRIAYRTVANLRRRAFFTVQTLPISQLDKMPYGDIVSRVTTDTDQLSEGLILGFSQLFGGIVTILITLGFMFTVSPVITLAVLVMTPVSLLTARWIARKTYGFFHEQTETRGEQTALINEMIGQQKTVQAFSYEKKALERFDEVNGRLQTCSLKAIFFSSITNPATRFINNLIYAAAALLGARLVLAGSLTVGGFVSFLAYAAQYAKPFHEISGVVTELQNAFACAARVFDLCDRETLPDDSDKPELQNPKGEVAFRDVSFSYDKNRSLIEHFSFTAAPGKKIAIVGPTGCGKTTLINLLMRFYDPDAGSIAVDGVPLTEVTRRSLRENFGMVLQETWIKNGTVKDNIAFGKEDATKEEIIAAAKAVHAHGFITRLSDGYDTVIGDDDSLSEGEKQLLCIARVMLQKPPMLILDEATSSIDTLTEQKVQDAFTRLMKGRTSFVVAHRLSTVEDADEILVIKDGGVEEHGTHQELLAKNGFYAALYQSQFARS